MGRQASSKVANLIVNWSSIYKVNANCSQDNSLQEEHIMYCAAPCKKKEAVIGRCPFGVSNAMIWLDLKCGLKPHSIYNTIRFYNGELVIHSMHWSP